MRKLITKNLPILSLLAYPAMLIAGVCLALVLTGCSIANGATLTGANGEPSVTLTGGAAALKAGTIEADAWRFSGNTADTQAISSDARGLYVAGGGVVRGLAIRSDGLGEFTVGGMSSLGVRGLSYTIDPETGAPTLTIESIDDDTIGVIDAMAALEERIGVRFTSFTDAQRDVFIANFSEAMSAGETLIESLERGLSATATLGTSELGRALGAGGGASLPDDGGG